MVSILVLKRYKDLYKLAKELKPEVNLPDVILCNETFVKSAKGFSKLTNQWWYNYYRQVLHESYIIFSKIPILHSESFDVHNSAENNKIQIIDLRVPLNEFQINMEEWEINDISYFQSITIAIIQVDEYYRIFEYSA